MRTIHFYFGEVKGSNDKYYSCYIEAKNELIAENKLIAYYDENLMSTLGELESINISDIESEEYYRAKASKRWIFL